MARSSTKPTKEVFDKQEGEQITRPADAKLHDGLPSNIPGMQLSVNPKEGVYKITDPLEGEEVMLERIRLAVERNTGVSTARTLRAAKGASGTLRKDEMKTLVREMFHLVNNGHAKVVKGVLPDMLDIEDLPGDFLLNSSNVSQWNQPRHEKDYDEWSDRMNRLKD